MIKLTKKDLINIKKIMLSRKGLSYEYRTKIITATTHEELSNLIDNISTALDIANYFQNRKQFTQSYPQMLMTLNNLI